MKISAQRYREIKSTVKTLTNLLDTTDPFKICKLMGIRINLVPLTPNLSGFVNVDKTEANTLNPQKHSLYIPSATIFLSNSLNPYSQKIVCAHELGHIVLQKNNELNLFDTSNPQDNLAEHEANIFAIELMPHIYHGSINYYLLNSSELYEYMNKKITSSFPNYHLL